MSGEFTLEAALARLRATRPALEKNFRDYLEAYLAFTRLGHPPSGGGPFAASPPAGAPVDPPAAKAILELTYATEFAWADPAALVGMLVARGELAGFARLAYAASRSDYRSVQILAAALPRLRFPLAAIERELAALLDGAATSGLRVSTAVAFSLGATEEGACRSLLSSFAAVARHSPAGLADTVSLAMEKAKSVPHSVVREWLERGADLMTSDRVDEGARHLRLATADSRKLFGMNQVLLTEYRHVLRIYATSLAGRELNVNAIESSMYGLPTPYTDGSTLFLPAEIDAFREAALNERAYSALAALQAAQVSMGSLSFDLRRIGFATELRERYGSLLPPIMDNLRRHYDASAASIAERADGSIEALFPGHRKLTLLETDHERFFYSFPTPDFARQLFCLVENCRVESRLSALYPGLREDFALYNAWALKRRSVSPLPLPPRTEEDGEEWERGPRRFFETLECFIGYSLSGRWTDAPSGPRARACLEGAAAELAALRGGQGSVQDSAVTTFRIYNLFFESFRLETICARMDVRPRFRAAGKPELWPEVILATRPELLREGTVPAAFAPESADDKPKAVDLSAFRKASDRDDTLRDSIARGEVKVYRYPEFDWRRGSYLANRCTLFEARPKARPNDYNEAALRRHAMTFKRTRKRFLALKPEGMELARRRYSGPELDPTDALDFCVALLRGESPDEKIYAQKVLNRRDLAVAVLLDASNSTDVLVGGARVIDIEKDSLCVLAAALDAIGDPFALYAFNSAGPAKVFVDAIKGFEEPWRGAARDRVAAIEPYESNRDGCAIRHVAARLARRPERGKLLLVLSDGIPADVDYGRQEGMVAGQYAIEDTRRAVIEARESGVTAFCLNIDSRAKDSIGRIYGRHFAVIDDVARLPDRLSRLYLRLTG